ncbi:MAG TPA: CbiX/SirB N-terminal domain-containing protein [Chloroflexota bacterium]|jgi:sirohydrochlorin cobaltochelatase|nr:CbiX/SirB N-terminal domain-containing protein [Chloroflexota bacterium]
MAQEIILLGHGSRRNNATDAGLAEVVRRLQLRVGDQMRVRLAGFEFTRPSLAEAVAQSAAAGVERATVVPYFLFGGREVRLKIPAELEELRAQYPDLELRYADCLGPDPAMADVCADRLRELFASPTWRRTVPAGATLGLVVVSRGSRSSEADAGLRALTAMVAERLHIAIFSHAQAEIGEPRLPEAAGAVIAAGAAAVAVQPYLIFPGSVLLDTVKPSLERVRLDHPGVTVAATRILGIDERMLDLALARAGAAAYRPPSLPVHR